MINKKTVLIIIGAILMHSCDEDGICNADLTLQRTDHTENQIRINGYYFRDVNDTVDMPFANIIYLYKNGVYLTSDTENLDNARSGNIEAFEPNEIMRDTKRWWGVFQIVGDFIEIERWEPFQFGCESRTTYERGIIISDTLFTITSIETLKNGNSKSFKEVNNDYIFRSLAQKPDSTNQVIE